jgi:DNA-directed RNA polymerase subunit RPC12/RpoP
MSQFMQIWISKKGALYSCDCSKCGQTNYSHEWVSDTMRNQASEWEGVACDECGGQMKAETFYYCGRQYAGRYSASGYLDCTEWHYGANLRNLKRELRAMYGD